MTLMMRKSYSSHRVAIGTKKRPKHFIISEKKVIILTFCCAAFVNLLSFFSASTLRSVSEKKNISHHGPESSLKEFSAPAATKENFDIRYDLYHPSRLEVDRMVQPEPGCYEGRFKQIDQELGVYVGGYRKDYRHLCNVIQFFNITSRSFIPERKLPIPPRYAETHQGVAVDETNRWLYIISGQKGGGCAPAIASSVRIHVDSGKVENLPPLPAPRYAMEVVVIPDQSKDKVVHVHAFGGASPMRNLTALQHWRLILSDGPSASPSWQELEPVPESGSHGIAFFHGGYIYHGGGCNLDFGVGSVNMQRCRDVNYLGVDSHHVAPLGLMHRFVTSFSEASIARQGHWERVADMPDQTCQSLAVNVSGRILVLGGTNSQEEDRKRSPTIQTNGVRAYDPERNEWEVMTPLSKPTKSGGMAWFDYDNEMLFVMRQNPQKPTMSVNVGKPVKDARKVKDVQDSGTKYRRVTVKGFRKCLHQRGSKADPPIENISFFDDSYEAMRTSSNKRNVQLPDLLCFPSSAKQVSLVVQCAKRNGYRVCARNGKQSFEGDSCASGILVDLSKLQAVEVIDQEMGIVKFGAGLTVGRAVLELYNSSGLILPASDIASIGLTGLVLSGGQGFLSRLYGMTSDLVSSVDLVTGSGEIVTATTGKENSDYVWLARGGGSGVQHFPGIITSVQFTGLPKQSTRKENEKRYTHFRIDWEPTSKNAEEMLFSWQQFHLDSNRLKDPKYDSLTLEAWLEGGDRLYVTGVIYGTIEIREAMVGFVVPKVKRFVVGTQPSSYYLKEFDFLSFHEATAAVNVNREVSSTIHGLHMWKSEGESNKWKGYSAVVNDRMSRNAFRRLSENFFSANHMVKDRYIRFTPLGGRIQRLPKNETPFWHRDAIFWSLSNYFWHSDTTRASVATILQSTKRAHAQYVEDIGPSYGGGYAGYCERSESRYMDLQKYYGDNADRILSIKVKRDPNNLFQIYLPNHEERQLV